MAHPLIAAATGLRNAPRRPVRAVSRVVRDPRAGATLALGALGVVFGDIGTSPLYALQTVFSIDHGRIQPVTTDVLGVISMVVWSLVVVVSLKYCAVAMRADNAGEGGILALAALARRALAGSPRRAAAALVVGLLGACLFYGDSIITPAISVISSIEGLQVPYPGLGHLVVPLAIAVLAVLFAVQPKGTQRVGRVFGPVMALWFAAIGVAGASQVVRSPGVLRTLSPSYAASFAVHRPTLAFVAMGAVVLTVTGAEALYADMGHFGRAPISSAWFALVFPALLLDYLGQAALILRHPASIANPFFQMLPGWSQLPMVLLATAATVIASQAVIPGAFSMTRQAVQLGLLPPLRIRQTSERSEGQIYLPAVNGLLAAGVLVLVLAFRHSARLATAYGVAVTGTFTLTTVLLVVVARAYWHWGPWRIGAVAVVFGGLDLTFFAGNLAKIVDGGWLPVSVAIVLAVVMTTWLAGRERVRARRLEAEGDLATLVERVTAGVPRVEGTAVFPHPDAATSPLALRALLEHAGVLHTHVVIVSAEARNVPHVDPDDAISVDDLEDPDDGIVHVTVRYGFFDAPDIPAALERARATHPELAGLDCACASYFLSRASLRRSAAPGMAPWRKRLFIALAHNAADPAEVFRLPTDRTVVMGGVIDV